MTQHTFKMAKKWADPRRSIQNVRMLGFPTGFPSVRGLMARSHCSTLRLKATSQLQAASRRRFHFDPRQLRSRYTPSQALEFFDAGLNGVIEFEL
jgi:hypothetical protein